MAVYLLHFEPSYKHAAHYLGWSPEVQARVNAHVNGRGARLTQVAHDAGCALVWVRTWDDGDRRLERKLKNRHSPQLCPICCGAPVQMPLMPWMPAYVPELDQGDDGSDDDGQHSDHQADTDEYAEDILDRQFWASGNW